MTDGFRFEATVHPKDDLAADTARMVADLDLDRVPDPTDDVRMLVDLNDCVRLLELGLEVRLQAAVPVRPLDPTLLMSDDAASARLRERIPPPGGAT
ncbi:hypothetical protein AB0I81_29160 [Nonomuraea sp. NPDC050404]|uniref:hypothetical protein n=1 Tax=Nonomuraea sp. NPDC050404 TaxID=3155783 RepID=UPI0033D74245